MKAKNLFGWLCVYAVAYVCWIPIALWTAYKMVVISIKGRWK